MINELYTGRGVRSRRFRFRAELLELGGELEFSYGKGPEESRAPQSVADFRCFPDEFLELLAAAHLANCRQPVASKVACKFSRHSVWPLGPWQMYLSDRYQDEEAEIIASICQAFASRISRRLRKDPDTGARRCGVVVRRCKTLYPTFRSIIAAQGFLRSYFNDGRLVIPADSTKWRFAPAIPPAPTKPCYWGETERANDAR